MKKLFTLFTKTLLVAVCLLGGASSAWADDVIFSMTSVTNGKTSVDVGTTLTITATFNTGSSAEVYNGHGSSAKEMVTKDAEISLGGSGNSYFHATFTTALAAGDVITSSTENTFYISATTTKGGSVTFPYTIKSTDTGLIGATNLYVWKNGGSKFTSFTITRVTGTAAPSITQTGNSVTLESATAGATVYYTLDGSEPTTSSATYLTAIALTNSCTVRAFAKKGDDASAIVKKDCYVNHSSVEKYLTSLGYNGGTVSGDVWTSTDGTYTLNNAEGHDINYVDLAGSKDGFKLNANDVYTIQPSEGVKVTKLVVVGKTWLQGDAGNASTIAFDDWTPASGTFFDYVTDGETYVKTFEFTPSAEQTYGQAITMRPGTNQLGAYIEVYGDIKTYTITYAAGANGTGSVAAGEKIYGVAFTLSSNTFTRDGFTQTGWATSDGGPQVYALGGSYTANADVTLYPVWSVISSTVVNSWDFTNWSDATKTGILADDTNWFNKESGKDGALDWSENNAGRSNKEAIAAGTTLQYGSINIPETDGLTFKSDASGMAILFNLPSTALGTYNGSQFMWLYGSSSIITIPNVKAGSVVSVQMESHKIAESRNITVKVGSTTLSEKSSKTGATTKTTMEYNVTADGDVTIAPSNKGIHIYAITVTENKETIPVSTKADRNYASFVATKKLDFSAAEGITAYIATGLNSGGTAVEMTPVNVVPAGTPIIVKTDTKGNTVNVPVTTDDADDVSGNNLIAGDGKAYNDASFDGYDIYYLASDQFHKANAGTLQLGKAYLKVATTGAPSLTLSFGSDYGTTAIESVEKAVKADGVYYNLSGQRVAQPTKGLYIVNGKKVLIK